ncbi:tRNA dihydrouridine synthase [Marinilabilia rubra]|uniref:tRNA-dihydrouridine synthase n=1 Tax=Marinilabilia rubra TaxID=2162893 RepID=A0A2U2BA96_9BACT|nr:tRNA-dihydrouridine synthase family protein [Marinilabilia rubra]PWD99999.1 dihydrouridine synthase [Marinilabilia rubra]
MSFTLLSSPLQGFTDFRFRNAADEFFGGINAWYAPYIRLQGRQEIKNSYQRDLLPENNHVPHLIPQVMTNSAEEFLFVAGYVQGLGYTELNLNLGCPYPMVTKRGLGSGLLKNKERINDLLTRVSSESDISISLKMRLGYEDSHEILDLLPILEKHIIKNIVLHPRLGKQLYKGKADLEMFKKCIENTSHNICYNGDIDSAAKFRELKDRFPTIQSWALGRGLIANPFLAQMIQSDNDQLPNDWIDQFSRFHDTLFRGYDEALSGPKHILIKMQSFWEYFSLLFSNPHKTYKRIKKAKNVKVYHEAVRINLEGEGDEIQ